MKKIVVLSLVAAASLGLAACSPEASNEAVADANVVDLNAAEVVEDVNAAAAADVNAMDAALDNAGDATEAAADNATNAM